MNHENLIQENRSLKKQNKDLLARLREYDIKADRKESQDPRAKAESITDGADVEFLGDMSIEVMQQMKATFEQNYDKDSVKNLHGKKLEKYHWDKIQYFLICAELEKRNGK